jgi:hypothetical protein
LVYKELQLFQKNLPDEVAAFERQRLLNLIDSKIRRREIESAMGFAEELFRSEVQYALIRRTRFLIKSTAALRKIIAVLLGVFFVFTVMTVLNIRPFFSLVGETVALTGIVSGIVVDRLLAKRLAKAVAVIMDVYENGRDTFVERILANGAECVHSEDWLRV